MPRLQQGHDSPAEKVVRSVNVPSDCAARGCPLAPTAKGFALPSGNLETSKIALLLETPATEEIVYDISKLPDAADERLRRDVLYGSLDSSYLVRGAPVVGRSGFELFSWALRNVGLDRSQVYLANVLQCYPGKAPDGTVAYPKGDARHAAESCCASLWWRLDKFNPDFSVINFHPAAIVRSAVALPLQIRSFKIAKELADEGHKVVVCCGGKAAKAWLGYGENVTRWCGHVQRETDLTRRLRRERLEI